MRIGVAFVVKSLALLPRHFAQVIDVWLHAVVEEWKICAMEPETALEAS